MRRVRAAERVADGMSKLTARPRRYRTNGRRRSARRAVRRTAHDCVEPSARCRQQFNLPPVRIDAGAHIASPRPVPSPPRPRQAVERTAAPLLVEPLALARTHNSTHGEAAWTRSVIVPPGGDASTAFSSRLSTICRSAPLRHAREPRRRHPRRAGGRAPQRSGDHTTRAGGKALEVDPARWRRRAPLRASPSRLSTSSAPAARLRVRHPPDRLGLLSNVTLEVLQTQAQRRRGCAQLMRHVVHELVAASSAAAKHA